MKNKICENCGGPLFQKDSYTLVCKHCSTEYPLNNYKEKKYIFRDESEMKKYEKDEKVGLAWVGFSRLVVNAVLILLVVALVVGISVLFFIKKKQEEQRLMDLIEMTAPQSEYIGEDYNYVLDIFKNAGFQNIRVNETKDLVIGEELSEGIVGKISIDGNTIFEIGDRFHKDVPVVITYRIYGYAAVPASSDEYEGKNYIQVAESLKNAGFENVKLIESRDLVIGGEINEGAVGKISIGGVSVFSVREHFRKDALIIITYRTYGYASPPGNSSEYGGKDYLQVAKGFRNAGFENVKVIESQDLVVGGGIKEGAIDKISIGGSTTFTIGDRFHKDVPVVITYLTYGYVVTPGAASEYEGKNYNQVVESFKNVGFKDIKIEEARELEYGVSQKEGDVKSVSVAGDMAFIKGCKVPKDATVIITYYTYAYTRIPDKESAYKGKQYNQVIEAFRSAGFVNVKTIELADLTLGWFAKEGEVESVTINGSSDFKKGDIIVVDSEIIVTYHIYKKDEKPPEGYAKVPDKASAYKGKNYEHVVSILRDAGFTNIVTTEVADLDLGWFAQEGEVDSITINGKADFEKGDFFPKDAAILISYHVFKN